MENGFVYQKWKLFPVEMWIYLGDGLVSAIIEFAEKWNHLPLRESSLCVLEESHSPLAPLQLSKLELKA